MNEALLQNIELGLRLGMGRNFTVFAPTDDAFELWEDEFIRLTPEQQNRTLLFHFNEDVIVTEEELKCQSKLISITGDTSRVKCRRKSPGVYVKFQRGNGNKELDNYPLIDIKSKVACSGIIHRVDHVLLPALFKPFEELLHETSEPTSAPTDGPTSMPTHVDFIPTESPIESEESDDLVPTLYPTQEGSDNDRAVDANPAPITATDPTPTEDEPVDVTPTEDPNGITEDPEPEEQSTRKVRINALGINLIMFSTLLLCFVFVCMRR